VEGIYLTGAEVKFSSPRGHSMLILLIILLILMFGAFPAYPYSREWGYYPSGGLGLIVVIVVIYMLLNHGF
jgi:Protein of unknown function (DUF3309)